MARNQVTSPSGTGPRKPRPHPLLPPKKIVFSAFCCSVSRSVVISSTVGLASRRPPPCLPLFSIIVQNASRSSAVETSPPPAAGNLGGAPHRLLRGSSVSTSVPVSWSGR